MPATTDADPEASTEPTASTVTYSQSAVVLRLTMQELNLAAERLDQARESIDLGFAIVLPNTNDEGILAAWHQGLDLEVERRRDELTPVVREAIARVLSGALK